MRQFVLHCVAIACLVGCGAADEHPLGGPYGGSGGATNTSHGDGTGGSTTPGDDAGNPDNTGDDGGVMNPNPPPPGHDSGTNPPPPGHDGGTNPPPQQDSGGPPPPPPPAAPTWTHIYQAYLAGNTQGQCPGCHSGMSSASGSYSWLRGKGYINGTSSALSQNGRSCLSWLGGNMPPSGPSSWSAATNDLNAWAAAGAQNN